MPASLTPVSLIPVPPRSRKRGGPDPGTGRSPPPARQPSPGPRPRPSRFAARLPPTAQASYRDAGTGEGTRQQDRRLLHRPPAIAATSAVAEAAEAEATTASGTSPRMVGSPATSNRMIADWSSQAGPRPDPTPASRENHGSRAEALSTSSLPRIVRAGPSSVKGTRRSFLTASQKRSSGPALERRRPLPAQRA